MSDTPNTRTAVEQFDKEFQRYTTKQSGKAARAVALARGELAKYNALLWQDKKLEQANIKKGRLTAEQRETYEKKVKDLEVALDRFHQSVASYNKTKAILSFILLAAFALMAWFQPWTKWFEQPSLLADEEVSPSNDEL